jgi:hypothetical protein
VIRYLSLIRFWQRKFLSVAHVSRPNQLQFRIGYNKYRIQFIAIIDPDLVPAAPSLDGVEQRVGWIRQNPPAY